MQDLATRAVTDLVEILEKGVEVLPNYLVNLIHRYALFGMCKWGFLTLVGVLLIYLAFRFIKFSKKETDFLELNFFVVPLCLIGGGIMIIYSIFQFFEALFVPEVFIINSLSCSTC